MYNLVHKHHKVVIYICSFGAYTGEGASYEDVKAIFNNRRRRLCTLADIEAIENTIHFLVDLLIDHTLWLQIESTTVKEAKP